MKATEKRKAYRLHCKRLVRKGLIPTADGTWDPSRHQQRQPSAHDRRPPGREATVRNTLKMLLYLIGTVVYIFGVLLSIIVPIYVAAHFIAKYW